MRKYVFGAFLVLACSALVTGSNSTSFHSDQKHRPRSDVAPVKFSSSDDVQVPTLAVATEAIQVIRSDNGWHYIKDAGIVIDTPVLPVQEVANSPPEPIPKS